MQLMEHWSNMAKLALHNSKSRGCILNSLQFVNVALRHTVGKNAENRMLVQTRSRMAPVSCFRVRFSD